MGLYLDLEDRKEKIRQYLRKNPTATFRNIKKDLSTKVNRVYLNGMDGAYRDAGIKPPRNFRRMSLNEKKKILIDYVRKNPYSRGHTIRKATRINFLSVFNNTRDMFEAAKIPYYEKKNILLQGDIEKRKHILAEAIRDNNSIGITELRKLTNMNIYHNFKSIKDLYNLAGVTYKGKSAKRRNEKVLQVLDYIKKNNYATQRDINRSCKTKVQELFERGIFEAYENAGIIFPFHRLKLHGCALSDIREGAEIFEINIAKRLSGYGNVTRLVRTQRGVADIILERKDKKIVFEIKNFKSHNISMSQIKQLNRYMDDLFCDIGFLICLKKPKKDTFLIGKNRIFILEESELNRVPTIIDTGSIG